jgi:membrane protein required for colicin V production
MSWLDVCLVALCAISILTGVHKGFARTAVGFVAAIAGAFCGLWFYSEIAPGLRPPLPSKEIADWVAFMFVFAAFIAAGAVAEHLLARLFKAGDLTWLDRTLGGAFGVVRGVFLATVAVLLVMAFAPKPLPRMVLESRLAPPLITGAVTLSSAAPLEVRTGFYRACDEIGRVIPEQWKDALARLRK